MKNAFNKFFSALFSPIRAVFGFLRKVVPGFKKLAELKPEIIASVLVLLFLLFIYIFARLLPSGDENATFWTQIEGWPTALLLIIGIPIVLYVFLRVLLRPPASPYPDIDESWNAGMAELAKNGLNIKNIPLCLVLGMTDAKKIRWFMEASNQSFEVNGITGPGQSLIWFASKDQIYVFLSNVGNLVQFVAKAPQAKTTSPGGQEVDYMQTANIQDFYNVKKTFDDDEPEVAAEAQTSMGTLRATDIPLGGSPQNYSTAADDDDEPEVEAPRSESVRAKSSEEKKRLRYLSQLIKRTREPISPINGMLTNIDVGSLESFPEELSRKLNDDFASLTESLGLVCAVTTIVSGLERDAGFVDFAERLVEENGPEFAHNKFGKSYRSWAAPTPEQLEKIAHAAVEEFDHFTHLIFSKRDALSANRVHGNRRMVQFLGRLYSGILPGLKVLLSRGHGSKSNPKSNAEFPRFAGCYFVGNDEHQDFFLRKVFERVEENQGEIEWTRQTTNREESWSLLTNASLLVGLLSLVAFVFLLFFGTPGAK